MNKHARETMRLTDKIETFPKITKPQVAALKKFGITGVSDVLLHFPFRYLDFSHSASIAAIKPGEAVTIEVTIKNIENRFSFRGRMSLAEAVVSDASGSLKVIWFNQGYLAKTLQKGEKIFLAGTPEYYKNSLQLTNPLYEKVSDFPLHTSRLVPVYRLPKDVYPKTFRNLVAQALPLAAQVPESLPGEILQRQNLPALAETIQWSHFPESQERVQLAKKRLAFEEIFINQLAAQRHKLELERKKSFPVAFQKNLITDFLATLPFALTAAQKKASWEVLQDIEKSVPTNRLIEGDVGSGKTLVALIAALQTVATGYQAVLLAPTEILARQHFETALSYSGYKNRGRGLYSTALLTNHYAKTDGDDISKKKLQDLISEGMPGLYIGTHALLGKKIKFKNLALVIIDEQHRFGVQQRGTLLRDSSKVPHLLSLTATPIPRTLQLAMYGELNISTIKSKPLGRKPILTKLVSPSERQRAYQFIRDQVIGGRQAFVITPLIEESETLDVKSAKAEALSLKKIFPELSVGLLHGKLKATEKETVMADFLAKKIHILVSTSVVEVGVDVPNASVMIIEGAERFGLAQLHQFRGRVGRAEHQSYCFLFTENGNPDSVQRLESFAKTQDGFALAELDLQQRGFGDFYGQKQSGWNFKYFNPSYTDLIPLAKQEALTLLKKDFNLGYYPLLWEKIKDVTVHFE